jgi:hypothetical protein
MNVALASRALGLSISVVALAMAAGCLTLTTADQGAGGGGTSSNSSSGGGLSEDACSSVQNCPNVPQCKTMACTNGTCISGFESASSQCNDNKVCDGAGSCVDCVVDNDCGTDSAICENNQCISCSDGQQNGNETAVDCGGSDCKPCVGMPCLASTACGTGYCVDGVCCDSPCTHECRSCNLPGKVGQCSSLPSGTEDPGVCDTTKACNGLIGQCLLKNGQSCTGDHQCISDDCSSTTNVCAP